MPYGTQDSWVTWSAVRRYLVWITFLMLLWEILQLPFYSIWRDASWRYLVLAILHCTAGDIAIALTTFVAAILISNPRWPQEANLSQVVWLVALGISYTIYSEWSNLARGSWAYSPLMPTLPYLGTGLAPLVQWLVLPAFALTRATRISRLNDG